jgi:hypothetical protein
VIARLKVAQGVAATLTAGTERPVGLGVIPKTPQGVDVAPPYYVLTIVGHTPSGAPYADAAEDASTVVQVTTVATAHDQAQLWADRATTTLLGRNPQTSAWAWPITIPGTRVMTRTWEADMGEDGDPAAAIVSYSFRIRLDLTPA